MTEGADVALRIGCVQYLNARPLIHGWHGPVDFDHPATLCRKLAAGELDVALVSSFEYLRNPIYTIADDLAVAADGPVYSVFLALAGAIEEVEEIELDPASQTSVNLLHCLLAERRLRPRVAQASLGDQKPITRSRAKLMIGDQAIRFRQRHETDYGYWDLAAQWKLSTGLPFVFALWLIRPEVENARDHRELAAETTRRESGVARSGHCRPGDVFARVLRTLLPGLPAL